jgi:uncharacterized membrane protein YhiD involved in acid resistance
LKLLAACLIATVLLLSISILPVAGEDGDLDASFFAGEESAEGSVLQGTAGAAIDLDSFGRTLAEIAPLMLLAALLGALVAYRRCQTVFEYDLFHAHILLSVAGALMMLIVGNQLVRAFGLLGAASVVRYRYGLRNPRDASMLIISLGLGMAAGVGLYALAVSAAGVVFVFARGLDLITARSNFFLLITRPMTLKVHTTQPQHALAQIERVLSQHSIPFSLRRYRRQAQEIGGQPLFKLAYSVHLSPGDNHSALTSEIINGAIISLNWEKEKPPKG